MSSPKTKPKWWQLYLSFPFLIALFALDGRLRLSIRGHQAVQIGIVMLIYGLIHLWLKVNRSALSTEDREQQIKIYRVIEIPAAGSLELEEVTTTTIQYDDFAPLAPAGSATTCPSSGNGPAAYGLGDRVRVTVNAPYTPILPLVNLPPGGFQISSTAVRTILKDINIQGTPCAPIGSMLVFFASPASAVDEGDVTVNVRVSVQAPYAENVLVDVQLDGSSTATQGFADDFSFTPSQVMIIAGRTFVDVPVTIHEDSIYEGDVDETIVLTLANPVNAALGAATTHTLTIRASVGMVFQIPDNQIVATAVEEDVAFGPANLGPDRAACVSAAQECGAR